MKDYYFAFISLSTIRFGDYVLDKSTDMNLRIILAFIVTESTVKQKHNQKYKVYVSELLG